MMIDALLTLWYLPALVIIKAVFPRMAKRYNVTIAVIAAILLAVILTLRPVDGALIGIGAVAGILSSDWLKKKSGEKVVPLIDQLDAFAGAFIAYACTGLYLTNPIFATLALILIMPLLRPQ